MHRLLERLTSLPRDARDTLFLLAVIAWIVVPHFTVLPLWCSAMTCAELMEKCKAAGVAPTTGTFFGPEGEGFLRINFACPRAQLTEGIKRLGKALEEE